MKNKSRHENQYEHPSFFKSAFAISGSVSPRIMGLVFITVLYTCVISLLQNYYPWVSVPVSPFEYAGLVMGLILVFRINAGYDRWWEARKLWGSVVNNSRNLAIIFTGRCKGVAPHKVDELVGLVAALPFLMKNHLRQDKSTAETYKLLTPKVYKELQTHSHKPNFISQKIAEIFFELSQSGQLDGFTFLQAEKYRANIIDCQGACERIIKTPMPYVMAIKSRRFILLFLLMLPIALVEQSSFLSILVTTLVSYTLLSLDQIGVELQNPFSKANLSHLPLDNICNTIEKNLTDLLQNKYKLESQLTKNIAEEIEN